MLVVVVVDKERKGSHFEKESSERERSGVRERKWVVVVVVEKGVVLVGGVYGCVVEVLS
jgi:hypothetical protein